MSKEGVIARVVDDMWEVNMVGKIEDNSDKKIEQFVWRMVLLENTEVKTVDETKNN